MKNSRNIREQHVGKNPSEKEEYRKLLDEDYVFDRTNDEPVNTDKTNSSTYQEEKKLDAPPEVKGKSLILKLRDGNFLKNVYVVGLVLALASALIVLFISTFINVGVHESKISNLQDSNKEVNENYAQIQQKLGDLDKSFSVFKEGTTKDLEFIKAILKI